MTLFQSSIEMLHKTGLTVKEFQNITIHLVVCSMATYYYTALRKIIVIMFVALNYFLIY